MVAILSAPDNSARAQAKRAQAQQGTPTRRLAGGHIHDLVALGKAVMLTPDEAKKFNAKAVGYSTNAAMPRVCGRSDATGEWSNDLILFLKKG